MDKKINLADLERENENLRRQLAELDELPNKKKPAGKGVANLKGVPDIATSIGKKIHAAPPGRGDRYYLDLYLLQTERERLVKEIASLKKRRLQLGMKVSNVDKEMAEKEEKARQDMKMLSSEPTTSTVESHKKTAKEEARGKKQETSKRYQYKEEEWNKFTLEY